MRQTIYTRISKSIGWQKKQVAIPTLEQARELIAKVKQGDEAAFRTAFEFHRFAPLSVDSAISETMYDAFLLGMEHFNSIYCD